MSTVAPLPRHGSHLDEVVAANARAEMARRRLKQEDLGAALGISRQAVSQKLRGGAPFSLTDVERLAALFRISPARLVTESDPEERPRLDSNQQPTDTTSAQVKAPKHATILPFYPRPRRVIPTTPARRSAPLRRIS